MNFGEFLRTTFHRTTPVTASVFDSTGIVLLSSEYQLPMLFVVRVSLSKVTPPIFFNPLNASVALI